VSRTRTLAASATTATLIGAGLLGAAPAAAKPAPDSALKVMTVNLYLGGSLGDAIDAAARSAVEFLPAAAKVYDTAIKTDFPLRAKWIAKTIKKQNPDVVTLNELTEWIFTSNSGVTKPNYDYLPILQDALKNEGMAFEVASVSDNADIGYSATIGIPYVNLKKPGCDKLLPLDDTGALRCQVRLKDRDAILYNTASSELVFTGTADHGNFSKQATFEVAGSVLSFNRGWSSAGFTWRGKPVTVMTSHLEVESQDGKGKKGKYGPKNWPSKVQVAQGKELLKIAKQKATQSEGRVVLAGDLNSDANGFYSPTYANLTKDFFKDSWKQAGGKFGKAVGATCCQTGTLKSSKRLDSGDPVIPTRIDLVLTRKAKAVWTTIDGTKLMQNKQPKWQSDHYFYAAAVNLK
jgi:endonuclease/exonuclease/phosphatase family metal-dependent hydrolase